MILTWQASRSGNQIVDHSYKFNLQKYKLMKN